MARSETVISAYVSDGARERRPAAAGRSRADWEGLQPDELILTWIDEQTDELRSSTEQLWEADLNAQSERPGVTLGFAMTHIARCADHYADRLHEARTGRPFPFDGDRRFDELPGSMRPGAVLIDDLLTATERVAEELRFLHGHVERRDMAALTREWLTELVVHRADLGATMEAQDERMLRSVLKTAVEWATDLPSWPPLTLELDTGPTLSVGFEGSRFAVAGTPAALLAWLTGHPSRPPVRTVGGEAGPSLPEWSCFYRHRAGDSSTSR